MIKNGLYKVEVRTELGTGNGVATLVDGRVVGGDSMMAYEGSYRVNGSSFSATIRTTKHSHVERMFALMGPEEATIEVTGELTAEEVRGFGSSSSAPDVNLATRLTLLFEL